MRFLVKHQTQNPSYARNRRINLKEKGLFFHSTGANNPYLSRYVDWPEELGPNKYGNHWNKPTAKKSMHGFIGWTRDKRDVAYVETLPTDRACWGAGAGSNGSANYDPNAYMQLEVCEDGLTDPIYYSLCWGPGGACEQLAVRECMNRGWNATDVNAAGQRTISSHFEEARRGYASNHGDPDHWMRRHGDSMDKFRARVQRVLDALRKKDDSEPEVKPAPVEDESANKWHMVKVKLTRQENADYFKKNIGDVVELPIEKYVLGVVPSEIPNAATAPLEACKAQAIASRTIGYARTKNGETITDESGVHQAYRAPRGVDGAYSVCHRAVSDTKGILLYYKGKVAESAVYSHSNGGHINSPKDAGWPGTQPYLVSKDDPHTLAPKKGHGVGMSQVGAVYMAKQGLSYSDILTFYYPGTTTKVFWSSDQEAPVPTFEPYFAEVVTKNPNSLGGWSDTKKSERKLYIPRGEKVEVIGHVDDTWAKIRYKGVEVFADRQYLKKVSATPAAPVEESPAAEHSYKAIVITKLANSLNIWEDDTKSKSLGTIPKGTVVDVFGTTGSFSKVKYGGKSGVVDSAYLARVLYQATVVTRDPNSLNIWTTTTKAKSLLTIPNGSRVDILQEYNDYWFLVHFKGIVGLCDRKYFKR